MILVTGGYGFIGSHLVRYLLSLGHEVVVVDSITYAANPEFVKKFCREKNKKYIEEIVDIRDHLAVARLMNKYRPDVVYHLAAESHVCRSLAGPKDFVYTNVLGTFHLIEEFKQLHGGDKSKRFVHVSTDEVFGELNLSDPPFSEKTPVVPRSPYAATKASSDHIVQAYHHSYGINTIITNCSNNFGPNQHSEKLIPATILRLKQNKPIRLYGSGLNIRDWLWVEDHAKGLVLLAEKGKAGERYCIGGENELTNLEIAHRVHSAMETIWGTIQLDIEFTNDRPTDDKRYAIDCSKLKALGWEPSKNFAEQLFKTIDFYTITKNGKN
jgi:dTDP-glucose 4,6-dehydratase